jgi:transglutaminase-like putative cysteine protease
MKAAIQYQMQYRYDEPVSFSPHLFRLFPKADRYLAVRQLSFQTNADATVNYRRDLFDNEIATCFFPGNTALLSASLHIELEIQERNAFDFLVAPHAVDFPFAYTPREAQILAPYRSTSAGPKVSFWQPPTTPQQTADVLVGLNEALHKNLAYERREEGEAWPSEETLRLGRGSCRDFSVLLADIARGLGLATRLASGYLCEFGDGEKRAEGALHAWTEIYVPGAGWLGFDPTNGYLCNHHHITAAVGLVPDDISPIHGNYYHDKHVPSQMMASLLVIPQ